VCCEQRPVGAGVVGGVDVAKRVVDREVGEVGGGRVVEVEVAEVGKLKLKFRKTTKYFVLLLKLKKLQKGILLGYVKNIFIAL